MLFGRGLLAEQATGLQRDFEKSDAFVEPGLISFLVTPDQLQASLLLAAPLRSLSVRKVLIESNAAPTDVHRVDSLLRSIAIRTNPSARMFLALMLIVAAERQRARRLGERILIAADVV